MIPLDIFSDPICPWCLIGKVRLERALESRPDHPFEIRWHPFQLNPDMPRDGMARQEYMSLKFGDTEGVMRAYQPVIDAAENDGIVLNLPAIERVPNTLDAHRLILWAGLEGRQSAMVSALFRAYFREGRDIGAPDVLLDLAEASGLQRDMIARLLASEAEIETVTIADRDARARGIQGVPFFILAGEYALPGAQPAALWQQVVDELTTQGQP